RLPDDYSREEEVYVLTVRSSRNGVLCAILIGGMANRSLAQQPPKQTLPAKQEQPEDLINADRPGIADGSSVDGPKPFQFEAGIQKGFGRAGTVDSRVLTVPTLLRFGINTQWE